MVCITYLFATPIFQEYFMGKLIVNANIFLSIVGRCLCWMWAMLLYVKEGLIYCDFWRGSPHTRTTDARPMKPFFIELQNFWAWTDK